MTEADTQRPIPWYTVDLLMAAKSLLHASPETTAARLSDLENAVIVFEDQMPLKDGEIMEFGDRPA